MKPCQNIRILPWGARSRLYQERFVQLDPLLATFSFGIYSEKKNLCSPLRAGRWRAPAMRGTDLPRLPVDPNISEYFCSKFKPLEGVSRNARWLVSSPEYCFQNSCINSQTFVILIRKQTCCSSEKVLQESSSNCTCNSLLLGLHVLQTQHEPAFQAQYVRSTVVVPKLRRILFAQILMKSYRNFANI